MGNDDKPADKAALADELWPGRRAPDARIDLQADEWPTHPGPIDMLDLDIGPPGWWGWGLAIGAVACVLAAAFLVIEGWGQGVVVFALAVLGLYLVLS